MGLMYNYKHDLTARRHEPDKFNYLENITEFVQRQQT